MKIESTDLLLIIDIQNDFCPGGALAVPRGDEVVSVVNKMAGQFRHVVLTQDWHPTGHSSFASTHENADPFSTITMDYGEQTLWPDHCVQGTDGARFHPKLSTDAAALIIRKGMNPAIDSYSAFFENDHRTTTGLSGYISELGIKRVFCAGLAFDFCVRFSAQDACSSGIETLVVNDACRAINMDGSEHATRNALKNSGINLISSDSLMLAT